MVKNRKSGKFVEPSNMVGEWSDCRGIYFWHDERPFAVKQVIEKMTGTLLLRDAVDTTNLSYGGTSLGGGTPQVVWLRFEAVINLCNLYSLIVKRTAPRKWVSNEAFLKTANRSFLFWCSKLKVPLTEIIWSEASPTLFENIKHESIELEATAANVAVSSETIVALQKEVLEALRSGMILFTAHKEGNTKHFFDGTVFVRADCGGDGDILEKYRDEDAMIACLRNFFEWESRRSLYPHRPTELDCWNHIMGQLVKCHV